MFFFAEWVYYNVGKKIINRIPLSVLRDAQIKLDEVMDMLGPYLIALDPPERQALVRMEAGSCEFLEMSYALAVENPELFPGFAEAAIFEENFSIVQELWTFGAKINQLNDNIRDTEMAAGNYALEAALCFYNMIKIAARHDIPGARVIYEELKPRRPPGKRKHRC